MPQNYHIYSLLLLIALIFSSCVNDSVDLPEDKDEAVILKIGYSADAYSAGFTRSENTLCWSDWNEKKIDNLDFYLIDENQKVSFYSGINYKSDDCNVDHTLLEFKSGGTSTLADLTFDMINGSSQIAMVANYPLEVTADVRIGKTFNELYSHVLTFSEGQYKQKQEKFVMVGIVDLPEQVSKYSNIVVPLRRIIAKIRVRVQKTDGTFLAANEFKSILCRYSNTVQIIPDELMPIFSEDGKSASSLNIFPANVATSGQFADSDWSYPENITDDNYLVRENGHVYYSCPSDWVDYAKIKRDCSRKGYSGHNDDDHYAVPIRRYEITDYDDTAPIKTDREMFLFIKAPYSEKAEDTPAEYLYRIPINYRLSSINDQQCFSEFDLINRVFPLYRVQRNHFYDITVILDRSGYPIASSEVSYRK